MVSPWHRFRNTPIAELISGSAHQSYPTDLTAPLRMRFAGRTILAVHVALEKAATVRVEFDTAGEPKLSGIRNISRRDSAEFVDVLRAEATATGARWAVVVLATGWQAVLAQRAARPEPSDRAAAFSRYKVMFDSPELVYPRAQLDRVYTAVDHPLLDRSVVFSVRRNELEELFARVRAAGLGVASAKITIAAQLEVWLAEHAETALSRDLLITDGLGALLLNAERGDFVGPAGAMETELPRQSVQRPSAADDDIMRFVTANGARPITFLGPRERYDAIKHQLGTIELLRPADDKAHDTHVVALAAQARHDLNFTAKEARPAIGRQWRRLVVGYVIVLLLLAIIVLTNAAYAVRTGYRAYRLERESANIAVDADRDRAATTKMVDEFDGARALHAWVAGNFHAQQFCYALLKQIPESSAIDKLVVERAGDQITVTFVVLGGQDAQLAARRAVENAIKSLRYNISGEEPAVTTTGGGSAIQYRMHILVPNTAGEVAS